MMSSSELFRELKDIFTWTYDNNKAYEKNITQHTKLLKSGTKLATQSPSEVNPNLKTLI